MQRNTGKNESDRTGRDLVSALLLTEFAGCTRVTIVVGLHGRWNTNNYVQEKGVVAEAVICGQLKFGTCRSLRQFNSGYRLLDDA